VAVDAGLAADHRRVGNGKGSVGRMVVVASGAERGARRPQSLGTDVAGVAAAVGVGLVHEPGEQPRFAGAVRIVADRAAPGTGVEPVVPISEGGRTRLVATTAEGGGGAGQQRPHPTLMRIVAGQAGALSGRCVATRAAGALDDVRVTGRAEIGDRRVEHSRHDPLVGTVTRPALTQAHRGMDQVGAASLGAGVVVTARTQLAGRCAQQRRLGGRVRLMASAAVSVLDRSVQAAGRRGGLDRIMAAVAQVGLLLGQARLPSGGGRPVADRAITVGERLMDQLAEQRRVLAAMRVVAALAGLGAGGEFVVGAPQIGRSRVVTALARGDEGYGTACIPGAMRVVAELTGTLADRLVQSAGGGNRRQIGMAARAELRAAVDQERGAGGGGVWIVTARASSVRHGAVQLAGRDVIERIVATAAEVALILGQQLFLLAGVR